MLKVLVTGGTGFIGTELIPKLVELGYDVYSLERYVTGRYILGERKSVKSVFADIRDYFAIKEIVRHIQPDVVIHLAAVSPVAYSYEHPQETIETNLTGTINLSEACLREVNHFRQFLFASTSETYGNGPTPKTEQTPQNPNSPYAVSKLACEKYLIYMKSAHNFPVTILRNFNTYGRKKNTHFVVERIIVQMLRGKTVRLGDPTPIRDFLYVDDHVNSYVSCLENEKGKGDVFNFCTGRSISIEELVQKIAELADFKGDINWNTIPSRPLDIKELVGDYTKAKHLLGWEPKNTFEEGLQKTINFWRQVIK